MPTPSDSLVEVEDVGVDGLAGAVEVLDEFADAVFVVEGFAFAVAVVADGDADARLRNASSCSRFTSVA